MEQHVHELEQKLQKLQTTPPSPGPSSSVMDSVESTATETERGTWVVYIQQGEKVPKFSDNQERTDSSSLEEWIELIENHIQLEPQRQKKSFVLEIDASHASLRAVLSQEHGGKLRPIAYVSRALRPTERNMQNYSSIKLEFLGLKWAVSKKFRG